MSAGQGHRWCGNAGDTQNQGNVLGDRPCVRQSKLYREHVGGNAMKDILGLGGEESNTKWKLDQCEGAYAGQRTRDPLNEVQGGTAAPQATPAPMRQQAPPQQQQPPQMPQMQQQPQEPTSHRRGAGSANKQSYNILTGQ